MATLEWHSNIVAKLLIIQGYDGSPLGDYMSRQDLGYMSVEGRKLYDALMTSKLLHVVLRYTPTVRALVVLLMAVGDAADMPHLFHRRASGVHISDLHLPQVLYTALTDMDEPATEVDLAKLLDYSANAKFVGDCKFELARYIEFQVGLTEERLLDLKNAVHQLDAALTHMYRVNPRVAGPPLPMDFWPTFPEWCMPSTPDRWIHGLCPDTAWQREATEVLGRAREMLKRELSAALLATDTHLPLSGVWRRPRQSATDTETATLTVHQKWPQYCQGLVWVARRDIWDDAVQGGASAEELYRLGLVCSVQSVDIAGELTVTARLGRLRKAHHTHICLGCPDMACLMAWSWSCPCW